MGFHEMNYNLYLINFYYQPGLQPGKRKSAHTRARARVPPLQQRLFARSCPLYLTEHGFCNCNGASAVARFLYRNIYMSIAAW